MGDHGGLEDLKHAIEQARALGSTHTTLLHQDIYASCLSWWEGPGEALHLLRENLARAKEIGMDLMVLQSGMNVAISLADLGRWAEARAEIERLLPLSVEADIAAGVALLQSAQAALLFRRGSTDGTEAIADALVRTARLDVLQPIQTVHCYAGAAYAEAVRGHAADARALLAESLRICDWLEFADAGVVRLALACGDGDLAGRLRNKFEPLTPLYRHVLASCDALLAEARGEHEAAAAGFADAAARWHEFGVPYEEALALLGQGRCLVALGRAPAAAPVLEAAREIFARLKATPALQEAEALLAGIPAH